MRSRPMPVSMFLAGSSPRIGKPSLPGPGATLELHEDEVPHLEVAVLVDDRAALAAVLRRRGRSRSPSRGRTGPGTPIDQKLSAMPRRWMRPSGTPDLVAPDPEGLVVVVVDGRPEPVLGEAEPALGLRPGEQLPGERDRLLLEVVPEGEVAQHLEERAVPGRLADLVDVGRADALLHARGPRVGRLTLPQEVGLEGHHARVDQQQRGVLGDQAGRGHHLCPRSSKNRRKRRAISADSISVVVLVYRRVGASRPSASRNSSSRLCMASLDVIARTRVRSGRLPRPGGRRACGAIARMRRLSRNAAHAPTRSPRMSQKNLPTIRRIIVCRPGYASLGHR